MPFNNGTPAISGHDEKSDKPHKYVKPRIGSQFQVDILPYVRPSDSVTQSASETETFRSEPSAPVFRAAPPLKKRGRPPKNKAGECFHGSDFISSQVLFSFMKTVTTHRTKNYVQFFLSCDFLENVSFNLWIQKLIYKRNQLIMIIPKVSI